MITKKRVSSDTITENTQYEKISHLSQFSNQQLKIGKVVFSLKSCTKKSSLIKLLIDFYDKNYIQTYYLSKNAKTNYANHQNSNEKEENTELKLQLVKIIHFHAIVRCMQEKFVLRFSQYHQSIITKNSIFNIGTLSRIQFPNLKTLDLSGNYISSIEGISFVEFNVLESLKLHDNKISSIGCLAKCNLKSLQKITLYENLIHHITNFNRSNFPKLTKIIIDSQKDHQSPLDRDLSTRKDPPLQGIEPLFKIVSLFILQEFILNKNNRILTNTLKQTLKKINPNIKTFKKSQQREHLLQRLQHLGGVGRTNNPQQLRRFIDNEVQPILRDRQTRGFRQNRINLIRQRLQQRYQWLLRNQQRQNNRQPLAPVLIPRDIQPQLPAQQNLNFEQPAVFLDPIDQNNDFLLPLMPTSQDRQNPSVDNLMVLQGDQNHEENGLNQQSQMQDQNQEKVEMVNHVNAVEKLNIRNKKSSWKKSNDDDDVDHDLNNLKAKNKMSQ